MARKSDYQKLRTNLLRLLPEVYHSAVNESLLETTFNRFLTKSELQRVIGFVGQGNPSALINRQIQEETPHRQAFQLQPLIYDKIGTVENISSWKDIQAELERLGVDLDRMQTWLSALSFNWAPPVDYDKIINFRDYYWYNPDNYADLPQYVTIQNPCNRAEAKLDEYENVLSEFGATHAIVGLSATNKTFQIQDDLTSIFTQNLVFFVKNSTNTTINNEYFTTVSSSYDAGTDKTTIVVNVSASPPFDDSIVDGDISLEELKFVFEAERDCRCNGSVGWDGGLWDDNEIGTVIWNAALLQQISWATEAEWKTANPGSPSPTSNDIWYDTTNDQLKQYSSGSWGVVQNNFSSIVAATTGGEFWDLSESCLFDSNIWMEQNHWIHKNQVPNFTVAKQAQIPIIEFIPTMELNEWTETIYEWKYRRLPATEEFVDLETTIVQPHLFELIGVGNPDASLFGGTGSPKVHYEISGATSPAVLNDIILNSRYGDLTDVFVPGYQFRMTGNSDLANNGDYTVVYSVFCEQALDSYYQTRIRVVETFNSTSNDGLMLPKYTSRGDDYLGLYLHWLYISVFESRPVNRQPANPILPISVTADVITQSYWDYRLHLGAQEFTLTTESLGTISVVSGGGSPNVWVLSGEHADAFNDPYLDIIGRTLHIQGNFTSSVNGEYTIVSAVNSAGNTIVTVVETIPAVASPNTGTAHAHWKLSLDPTLFYHTRTGVNELRVYKESVRQYGNYEEDTTATLVGSPVTTTSTPEFVASIIVQDPIEKYQVVLIEVGAAASNDIENISVPVRVQESDFGFTPPIGLDDVSIVRYKKLEQVKTQRNQYPLFDLYDVEGQPLNRASKVFAFQESQDYPVNASIQRRIVRSSDGRTYYFEQFLIDEDNGPLFAYRDTSTGSGFWFDTDNDILYRWDNDANTWDSRLITSDFATSSLSPGCYVTPIVSDTPPEDPWWDIDGMVWFNTNNNTINVSDGSGTLNSWGENVLLTAGIVFAATDPTLQSIWRTGPDDVSCQQRETYVPEYVDENRDPVTIGDPSGDWEIPDQLYYNVLHENRKVLSSSELLAHFQSIIEQQDVPPGLFGSAQLLFHALTDINFGAGGKIKEYNDGFDTFISSVFVQNVNPLQLYEFAHDAYENALNTIKDYFRRSVVDLMTNVTEEFLSDLSGNITNALITRYEQNDAANIVFGDSNTYDPNTGLGVRNWPATLPFARLARKVYPLYLRDDNINLNTVRFHDGHYSQVGFVSTNVEAFTVRIINASDARVTNPTGKMGTSQFAAPPELFSTYQGTFGNTVGIYWRDTSATNRPLYRMSAVRISPNTASPAVSLPEGSYWYDTTAGQLKVLDSGAWVAAPGILPGRLADFGSNLPGAWERTDLNVILAQTYLEIETRLYDVAPDFDDIAFDFDSLNSELALRNQYRDEAFAEFLAQVEITSPYDNVLYDDDDPFTWNYKQSNVPGLSVVPKVGVGYVTGGTWQDVYQRNYGTPYPHFEPWVLQGFESKPDWWDTEYPATLGRRWSTQMWDDIVNGIVPAGRVLPSGAVSTGTIGEVQRYNYVSVNITDIVVTDGNGVQYQPDELFPPLLQYLLTVTAGSPDVSANVRSIYTDIVQVNNPQNDYNLNDRGVVEWAYFASSQYSYDELKVAFRMQPMRFIFDTLGYNYLEIGCLQVEQNQQKVLAHQDTLFQGELLPDLTVLQLPGTLQWYVNFNRYNGYDGASSNFRRLWTDWTTKLAYQFSSVVDTESFLIYSRNFDVVSQDWFITLKRSPGFADFYLDAFDVTLVQAPPPLQRVDTESQWIFDLSTFSPTGRRVSYYGVYKFPFAVSSSPIDNTFTINDPYSRQLPWEDGQQVVLSSTQFLPSPLQPDTFYYINALSTTDFSLSESPNGPVIEILSDGVGTHYIAQIASSFDALSGATTDKIWYKYQVDTSLVLDFLPPLRVIGFQDLISIIFGYEEYEKDVENYRFNHEATDIDPDTGRVINWQLEVERLINWAYLARSEGYHRKDFYQFEAATASPSELSFTAGQPQGWTTGQKVIVFTDVGGTLPEPLLSNQLYYLIRETTNTFKLALTSRNARQGIAIDLLTPGSGDTYIQELVSRENAPSQEVNPFRNNIWLYHEQGIVADLLKGPFADVRVDQALLDQYKRAIPRDGVLPLRQDRLTRIAIKDEITNDIERSFGQPDIYNYLHLSSVHIFLDGYEHVLLFNNYASDGSLIYDSFIGLNTARFDVQFDRNPEFTLRPVLGGYTLLQNKDVGEPPQLIRNLEGQTEDLRYAYDTFRAIEANDIVEEGRKALGYDGLKNYLLAININPKSQFLFWRGMIQQKGSVNSVKAFINSRRFVDAKIDEFWAVKLADFGSGDEFNLPEIMLTNNDGNVGELRLEFTTGTPVTGFEAVSDSTPDRWYEFPNQADFFTSNGNMYFNTSLTAVDNPAFTNISGTEYYVSSELFDSVIVTYTSVGGTPSKNITTTLVEGVDYTIINSQVVKFITDPTTLTNVIIYLVNPAKSKHNPAKVRDVVEELTISPIIIWDPARGHHYYQAIHLVDVQGDNDPVEIDFGYTVTGETAHIAAQYSWGGNQVNTTWLDTAQLGYYPYADTKVYTDILDRLKKWGKLADWADYNMYQWTASDVLPTEYDALAELEEGDITIDQRIRTTGRVRPVVYMNLNPTATEEVTEEIAALLSDARYTYITAQGALVGSPPSAGSPRTFAGQSVFDLAAASPPISYAPSFDGSNLMVFVNGVHQVPNLAYTESSPTTITFVTPLSDGKIVEFYAFERAPVTTGSPPVIIPTNLPEWIRYDFEVYQVESKLLFNSADVFFNQEPIVDSNPSATGSPIEIPMFAAYKNGQQFIGPSADSSTGYYLGVTLLDAAVSFSSDLGQFTDADHIALVKFMPSDDEIDEAPELWKKEVPYTTGNVVENGEQKIKYYFWVEDKTIRQEERNKTLTMVEATTQLENIPVPYFIIQGLRSSVFTGSPTVQTRPQRYTQAVIRGLRTIVNDDDRYILRFTRDFTLRDNLQDVEPNRCLPSLQTTHQEWLLFREEQQFNVERFLWDLATESIIGQTLASLGGTAVRVPSLDKELYDVEHNTSTRIGIGNGQAFADGTRAWEVIVQYLQDGDNDFAPVDINAFISSNNILDLQPQTAADAQAIADVMNDIYNTFTFENVNRMFFSILRDAAFPYQLKYKDIFKTSYVALHGIRILEVAGIFND